MQKRSGVLISILLAFATLLSALICTGLAEASPSLIIEPSEEISLGTGEICELSLSADSLPEGLSGYKLTVELTDPDVAEIQAVNFPEWASLTDVSELPASSVKLKAVDLQEAIDGEAEDVELAVLTLKGLEGGSTGITVTVSKMDDDSENTIILEGAEYPKEDGGDSEEDGGDSEEDGGDSEENTSVEDNVETSDSVKTSDPLSQSNSSSMSVIQEDPNETAEEMKNSADENSSLKKEVEISSPETSEKQDDLIHSDEEADESKNDTGNSTGNSTLPGFGFIYSISVFVFFVVIYSRSKK